MAAALATPPTNLSSTLAPFSQLEMMPNAPCENEFAMVSNDGKVFINWKKVDECAALKVSKEDFEINSHVIAQLLLSVKNGTYKPLK